MRRAFTLLGCATVLAGLVVVLSSESASAVTNNCNTTPVSNACHATGGLTLTPSCQTGSDPSYHFVITSPSTPPSTFIMYAKFKLPGGGTTGYVQGTIDAQGTILAANVVAPGSIGLVDAYFVRPRGFTYDQFNLSSITCTVAPSRTPTVTGTPTKTPTATATTPATCPAGTAAITQYNYLINGSQVVSDLGNAGVVDSGDTVKVNFQVAAGCSNLQVSLVSYTAPGSTFDPNTAYLQKVYQSATGTFGAGWNNLTVTIPNCYFQIDFVRGAVITQLGPAGSNNFYSAQNRLIDADNGGTKVCNLATPTRTPTATITATPTRTLTATPTSTPNTTQNVCDNNPQPNSCHVTGGLDLIPSCQSDYQAVFHFIINKISGPNPTLVTATFVLANGSTVTRSAAIEDQGANLAANITAPDGTVSLRDAYFIRPTDFTYNRFNLSSINCVPGNGPPPGEDTPELDSIILFGVGGLALGGYLFRQRRRQRGASAE